MPVLQAPGNAVNGLFGQTSISQSIDVSPNGYGLVMSATRKLAELLAPLEPVTVYGHADLR